jgi:O-antigen/teichoic acid export membrane protein
MIWRLLERFGAHGVTFVVSIILARLLDPEVYGTIAIVTVFTSIMQVFVDSGLGNALVQKKESDSLDFNSVFFFNLVFCIVLYTALFFFAPLIAWFYEKPELTSVLRVLGLTLVISGVKNIQQAYVTKHMLFRKFFFATLGGTIGAAIIGIIMAYKGYGVWALVIQNLFNQFVDTLFLWITVKWKPSLSFSFKRLKSLLSYGWKLLAAKLLDSVFEDIRTLIIGKWYSSSDLAYYNRGKHIPQLLVSNISTSIDGVLFSTLSKEQDNLTHVKNMTRRSIKITSYIVLPLLFGVAAIAEVFINVLLTEKWLASVPYLRIFCFSLALHPILIANTNAIKAIGRSDIYLKLETIRKIVGLTTLIIAVWFGPMAIAISVLANSLINMVVNAWPKKTS